MFLIQRITYTPPRQRAATIALVVSLAITKVINRISTPVITVGFLLFVTALWSQTIAAQASVQTLEQIPTETDLARVYHLYDPDASVVTVALVILAGEVDVTGSEGLSHYVEHLMFWHADGLSAGEISHARDGNAWVNGILTHYYNRGEPEDVPAMFDFASRLLTAPTLQRSFMLDERNVIAREYDFRVAQNPLWSAITESRQQLYDNHPVARRVIGTPESIRAMSLDEVNAFYQQHYHAKNALLVVAGDIKQKQVQQLSNQYFPMSDAARAQSVKNAQTWRNERIDTPLDARLAFTSRFITGDTLVRVSLSEWEGTGDALDDVYTQLFVEAIFNSNLPGSIAKPLRLDEFIIAQYDISMYSLLKQQVEFMLVARADDNIPLDTVSQRFSAFLTDLSAQGMPLRTIERVRKRLLQTARRQSGDADETLRRLMLHLSLNVPVVSPEEHLRRLERVNKASIDSLLLALAKRHRVVDALVTSGK